LTFTLAKETGWSEFFILWQLPMSRALQYYHAALWGNGSWTVPLKKSPISELDLLFSIIDTQGSVDED
jgi:hypothetical protein